MILFIINTAFSFILSAVEDGFALFLMVFLFSLGFIEASQLPSWIPVEKASASPFFI